MIFIYKIKKVLYLFTILNWGWGSHLTFWKNLYKIKCNGFILYLLKCTLTISNTYSKKFYYKITVLRSTPFVFNIDKVSYKIYHYFSSLYKIRFDI